MRIDHYERKAGYEVRWWLDQIELAGRDAVRATAAATGSRAFRAMLDEQATELRDLLVRTEAERVAILSSRDATDRHLTMTAATYIARCGYAWLQAGANSAADASVDIHPLEMLLRAENAARELQEGWPELWPFDDDVDPFGE